MQHASEQHGTLTKLSAKLGNRAQDEPETGGDAAAQPARREAQPGEEGEEQESRPVEEGDAQLAEPTGEGAQPIGEREREGAQPLEEGEPAGAHPAEEGTAREAQEEEEEEEEEAAVWRAAKRRRRVVDDTAGFLSSLKEAPALDPRPTPETAAAEAGHPGEATQAAPESGTPKKQPSPKKQARLLDLFQKSAAAKKSPDAEASCEPLGQPDGSGGGGSSSSSTPALQPTSTEPQQTSPQTTSPQQTSCSRPFSAASILQQTSPETSLQQTSPPKTSRQTSGGEVLRDGSTKARLLGLMKVRTAPRPSDGEDPAEPPRKRLRRARPRGEGEEEQEEQEEARVLSRLRRARGASENGGEEPADEPEEEPGEDEELLLLDREDAEEEDASLAEEAEEEGQDEEAAYLSDDSWLGDDDMSALQDDAQRSKRRKELLRQRKSQAVRRAKELRWEMEDAEEMKDVSSRELHLGTSTMSEEERRRWESTMSTVGQRASAALRIDCWRLYRHSLQGVPRVFPGRKAHSTSTKPEITN